MAGQKFPSIRDEITALRDEVNALREEYLENHPECAAVYQESADMDISTLRREVIAMRKEDEAAYARRAARGGGVR